MNEANWDRIARTAAGVVLAIIGFVVIGGGLGIALGVIALIPLVTGLTGFCPLYSVFGFRTNEGSDGSA